MPKVTFYPANISIEAAQGITILQAARDAGIVIESPCNGIGTCGKCKVKLDQSFVLSCHAQVRGDISVEVISTQQHNQTLKILSYGKSFNIELEPSIRKEYQEGKDITLINAGDGLIGQEAGDTTAQNYGLVVDIGTTTLVISLVNLNTGRETASSSALNPQSLHAQDVLSRIHFTSHEKGLDIMYSELIREINRMIGEVTTESGVDKANIYEVIFSGNTTMLHLATKTNPQSLGKFPYTPELYGGHNFKAKDHCLDIAAPGLIYLPPIISAYVGADITSGILASQLHKEEGVTIFVDIGTNGELVIGVNGKLSATSTAAGPAFEGMNISCGMRAGKGAIEAFNVEEDGSLTVKTIGDAEAVGICGSGLLDIVGELVAFGAIDKRGRLVDPDQIDLIKSLKERLVRFDEKIAFQITDKVYLTQRDIRQVQLAKGAVRAGIEYLLKNQSISACEVNKVLIAGSFGYHLRAKSLVSIGLLPAEFGDKIEFIGNTSKTGGQAFLLNNSYRREMEEVVRKVDVLDLASYKDFERVFVSCLSF